MIALKQHLRESTNPCLTQLIHLMIRKQSNLALAADVLTSQALLQLADQCGPYICLFKTHIDMIQDFTPELTSALQAMAKKHDFMLFEDRKFADIGKTVEYQYTEGLYRINDWAHITNTHIISGEGVVDAMKPHGLSNNHGLLILAQMSAEKNHFTPAYTQACVTLAQQHKDFVFGFICQEKLCDEPGLLHMTPGVHPNKKGDGLNQRYLTPKLAFTEKQTDIIIVGRGITESQNPAQTAELLQSEAWQYAHID